MMNKRYTLRQHPFTESRMLRFSRGDSAATGKVVGVAFSDALEDAAVVASVVPNSLEIGRAHV